MSIVDELIAVLGFEVTGEDEARRFEDRIDGLNKGLDRFATNVGRIAGAASLAFAGAMGVMGRSVIDTTAQFEGYQATLETIEESAEKARQSLGWIADFGKTTPYDVAQVTEAFVALKAYGIDPIADDALRTLGDTASAMGKPLTQAVEAFADAATYEFERLKEFGIRAQQQGDEVTFSWTKNGEEMTRTIQKNSNEIRSFLLETMGNRFSGAMDRQSRTWKGMMSNLGDTWTDFKRRVGEAGFFDSMKGNLQGILDYLGRLDADGTLDRWAKNLSTVLTKASDFFGLVAGRIATNIAFIVENFDALQMPLTTIGVIFGFLIARAFPLITIFTVLALVVDDFLAYLQGGESYIGNFIEKIQELTGVSEGAAKAIAGLGGAVMTALTLAFLIAPVKIIKSFGRLIFTGLAGLAPLILKGASVAFAGLSGTVMKALTTAFIITPGKIIKSFGRLIFIKLAALAPMVLKGASAAFALLSNPIGWAVLLAGAASGLIYYFWDELVVAWDWLKEKTVTLFTQLKDWFLDIDWMGAGIAMGQALFDGLRSIGDAIKNWFTGLVPDWAKDWFSEGGSATRPQTTDQRIADEDQAFSVPVPQGGSRGLSGVAGAIDPAQAERIMEMLERNRALSERIVGEGAVEATLNDSRADNRQFPMETNVVINQAIQQAIDAPRRAAEATGNAVVGAIPAQRSQAEMEPSF